MTEKSIRDIDFSYIRYANCWEDANVLLKGLDPGKDSRILSIGSAGDNSFSLLSAKPEKVTAIDVNPSQLFLIELKKAAIKHLPYPEVLAFLGFEASSDRLDIFQNLRNELPSESFLYWSNHLDQISKGIIHQGKFEKYFQFFAKRVLPLVHRSKTIEKLMFEKTLEEQQNFYNSKWNTLRWRLLFNIFFSRPIMGRYGRDRKFFKEVKEPVAKSIFKRVGNHLTSPAVFGNEFLEYILFSSFRQHLPHYLKPENYKHIKDSIDKLEVIHGSFGTFYSKNYNYSHLNLSNIFEYLSEKDYQYLVSLIAKNAEPNTKFLYWNLLVPRRLSAENSDSFEFDAKSANELKAIDKGFFYSPVIVDKKRKS